MRIFAPLILSLTIVLGFSCTAVANPALEAVEAYVLTQIQGYPGKVSVKAGPLDPRMRLPHCVRYQAYTPAGGRLMGNTSVGLRCLEPNRWNIFVPTRISVETLYVTAATTLMAGQTLRPADMMILTGDLGSLPNGVLTDPSQAVGKALKYSVASGQPLRQDQLSAPIVIRQGQSVQLIFQGQGFTASNEGKALSNGLEGQPVQVRTQSGTVVSGIAQPDGSVLVGTTTP